MLAQARVNHTSACSHSRTPLPCKGTGTRLDVAIRARVSGLVQDVGGRLWIYATGINSRWASLRLGRPALPRDRDWSSASDGEQGFELCDVLLGLRTAPRHFGGGWIIPVLGRYPGLGATRRLARPGAKLAAQRSLDEREQIAGGLSDGGLATARCPLIEDRLLECRLERLQCRKRPGLLFGTQ